MQQLPAVIVWQQPCLLFTAGVSYNYRMDVCTLPHAAADIRKERGSSKSNELFVLLEENSIS